MSKSEPVKSEPTAPPSPNKTRRSSQNVSMKEEPMSDEDAPLVRYKECPPYTAICLCVLIYIKVLVGLVVESNYS